MAKRKTIDEPPSDAATSEEPSSDAATSDAAPDFEAALAELEEIARDLDGGALGLDASLARYERGMRLLRQCYNALDNAEQKIALLAGFDADGNAVTAPFDATATAEKPVAGRRRKPRAEPADDVESSGKGLF